jgi:hypothetical protein
MVKPGTGANTMDTGASTRTRIVVPRKGLKAQSHATKPRNTRVADRHVRSPLLGHYEFRVYFCQQKLAKLALLCTKRS